MENKAGSELLDIFHGAEGRNGICSEEAIESTQIIDQLSSEGGSADEPKVDDNPGIDKYKSKKIAQEPIADVLSEHNISLASRKLLRCMMEATLIWLRTFIVISPVLMAIILFVWIYYLPALVLTPKLLGTIRSFLYNSFLYRLRSVALTTSIILIGIHIFSLQFMMKPILYGLVPGFIIDNLFPLVPGSNDGFLYNVRNGLTVTFISLCLYLIHKSRKPDNTTAVQEANYILTKDGSVCALAKGLAGFFVIVILLLFNLVTIFLESSFVVQLGFRFVVFPILFHLSNWYQTRVITNLSKEHMSKRLVQNKCCNHYIQFIGRILVSNISMNKAASFQFVLVNFAGSVIEFLSTISFKYRMRLSYRIKSAFEAFYRLCKLKFKRKFANTVAPDVDENVIKARKLHTISYANVMWVNEEDKYVDDALAIRADTIYDSISSEIISLVLVPLLMYFLHPLISSTTPFQVIASIQECFSQIAIQIVFEYLGDFASLTYELYCGHLDPHKIKTWRPFGGEIYFVWSVFCVIQTQLNIMFYS